MKKNILENSEFILQKSYVIHWSISLYERNSCLIQLAEKNPTHYKA